MKTDINGCSTCKCGEEQFEEYWSHISNKKMVQYDFRTENGKLFSTIASSLEIARKRRDDWMNK